MNAKKQDVIPNEDLAKVSNALAEFSKVDAGLAAMRQTYAGPYDATTPSGMAKAKNDRVAVREVRYAIEDVRKSAKAPILALGKTLDREALRITCAIEEIERPIDNAIKLEEERIARERQARIDAEHARVKAIQERIEAMRSLPVTDVFAPINVIAGHLAMLGSVNIENGFEEFRDEAFRVKTDALQKLGELHDRKVAEAAEAERQRLERIELDKRRAEQDERDRLARVEADRVAEETRQAQAKLDADRRAHEEKVAADNAKREEADRAERARQDETDRANREESDRLGRERERIEQEKAQLLKPHEQMLFPRTEEERKAEIEPTDTSFPVGDARRYGVMVDPACPGALSIVEVLSGTYGVEDVAALAWLQSIDWKTVNLP